MNTASLRSVRSRRSTRMRSRSSRRRNSVPHRRRVRAVALHVSAIATPRTRHRPEPSRRRAHARVFDEAGYKAEVPYPHWLAKIHSNGHYLDVMFGSGNGVVHVDDRWFAHAVDAEVLDRNVRLVPQRSCSGRRHSCRSASASTAPTCCICCTRARARWTGSVCSPASTTLARALQSSRAVSVRLSRCRGDIPRHVLDELIGGFSICPTTRATMSATAPCSPASNTSSTADPRLRGRPPRAARRDVEGRNRHLDRGDPSEIARISTVPAEPFRVISPA